MLQINYIVTHSKDYYLRVISRAFVDQTSRIWNLSRSTFRRIMNHREKSYDQKHSAFFYINTEHFHHPRSPSPSSALECCARRVLRGAQTAREDGDHNCSRAFLVEYDDGNFRLENRRLIFLTFSHFWPWRPVFLWFLALEIPFETYRLQKYTVSIIEFWFEIFLCRKKFEFLNLKFLKLLVRSRSRPLG